MKKHVKKLFAKRKHFRLGIVLLSLIILSGGLTYGYLALIKPLTTKAAWMNDNWKFRVRINIASHTAAETDVYVTVPAFDATDTTKFQTDCGDLRFTNEQGQILPYFVNDCDASSTVRVLFPSMPAGEQNYYMYYGNPSAADGFSATDFTTAASGLGAQSAGSETKGTTPIAYWRLDEATDNSCTGNTNDACDSTSSRINLAETSMTWQNQSFCVSGSCGYFTGSSSFLSTSDNDVLDFGTGSFTIAFWFRHPPIATNPDYAVAKYNSATGTDGGYKIYMNADGTMTFGIDSDQTSFPSDTASSTSSFADNKWHYLEAVKNGTTSITLYIDGKEVGQDASITGSSLSNTDSFYIGVDGDGSSNSWQGFLDDIKIYNYARSTTSPSQILADLRARGTVESVSTEISGDLQKNISDGLAGYWKADETSGNLSDSSGNSSTLTNTNTATFTAGKFGNAVTLAAASSQYGYAADSSALSITGSLTLSAWIYPQSVSAGTYNILAKWDGANESYRLLQNGDELRLELDANGNYVETTSFNLTNNSWYHVAGVYNASSSTAQIYVNGSLVSTTTTGTIPSSIEDDAGRFHIGAEDSTTAAANFYNGKIDEARVYNRALNDFEIRQLYTFSTGPIAYWNVDENYTDSFTRDGGMAVYQNASTDVMLYRRMNASGNWVGAAGSVADIDTGSSNKRPGNMYLYSSPTRNEKILLTNHTDASNLYSYGQVFNGDTQTWGNVQLFETIALSSSVITSQAHNNVGTYLNDGRFIAFHTDATTTLQFSIWDGTSWSTVSSATQDITKYPLHLVVKNRPGTNEVMVAMNATNLAASERNIYTLYYDGTGTATTDFTVHSVHAGTQAGSIWTEINFDFTWSRYNALRGALVYQDQSTDTTPNINIFTADGAGSGSWGTANEAVSIAATTENSVVTDRPGTNEFIACFEGQDATPDIDCLEEADGDTTPTFTSTTNGSLTTGTDTDQIAKSVDIEYESISGDLAVAIYSDNTSTPKLKTYNPSTNTWDAGATSLTALGGVIRVAQITADPYGNDMALMLRDISGSRQLEIGFWDGGSNSIYVGGDRDFETLSSNDGLNSQHKTFDYSYDVYSYNDTVYDRSASGNNLHLTLNGNMHKQTYAPGRYGSGINLNGSNSIAYINDSSTLDFTASDTFSIQAWVKPTSNVSSAQYILSKTDGLTGGYKLYMDASGNFCFGIDDDATWTPDDSACSSGTRYDDFKWHHVAGQKIGTSQIILYVDGVLVSTDSSIAATGTLANSNRFIIGADRDNASQWKGIIDEIKVYNYERSPLQINEDINAGHPPGGSPIGSQMIYWKADEGYGTTLNNSISTQTSLAGTITGPAWDTTGSCKIGKCLKFTAAADTVSAGDVSFLDGQASMSATLWLYPTSIATSQMILSKANQATHRMFTVQTDSATSSEVRVYIASSASDTSNYFTTSGLGLANNQWQQLSVTYDGTLPAANRIKVYKNGTAISGSVTGTIPSAMTDATTSNLKIGRGDDSTYNSFVGLVDETKIYNYALPSDHILIDLNANAAIDIGTIVSASEAAGLANGAGNPPVAWWNMDENNGASVNDSSGNANTGTLSGNQAPQWKSGKLGSALEFVGTNSYVTAGNATSVRITGALTLSAWIRLSNNTAAHNIITRNGASGNFSYKLFTDSSGLLNLTVSSNGTATTTVTGATTLIPNTWYHVTGVYSPSTYLNVYINGVLDGSNTTSIPASISNPTSNVELGSENGGGTNLMAGMIDEAKIYNYSRSQDQISYEYNRGKPVAHFKLDECQGSTVYESMFNAVSGTITVGGSGTQTAVGTCSTSSTVWGNGATGKYNFSVNLDGTDDYISTGSFSPFAASSVSFKNASWGGWVYPTTSAASKTILEKATEVRIRTDGSSNAICGIYYSAAFNDATSVTAALTLSAWNHVFCTYDGSNIKTYINGKLANTTANTNSITAASSALHLGQNSSSAQRFEGQLDDFRLYNYALSASQIRQVFNNDAGIRFGPETGSP